MTDWSQIVTEHGPAVWRTARRLLGHEADAADCFQRTFVSALELERKEPVRNWPALLKRLATARALEQLRQRRRERDRMGPLPELEAVDGKAVDPAEAAVAGDLTQRLRLALAELEPRQAEVVSLACLEGLTYEEIGGVLGLPTSTVGVLLHRARSVLRERLRPYASATDASGREV